MAASICDNVLRKEGIYSNWVYALPLCGKGKSKMASKTRILCDHPINFTEYSAWHAVENHYGKKVVFSYRPRVVYRMFGTSRIVTEDGALSCGIMENQYG